MANVILLRCCLFLVAVDVALTTSSCGYGVNGNTPASVDVLAPQILQQPASQSVPMGLSATYSVTAAGTSPQYQWTLNGVAIPGATSNSYVTRATTFAETGSTYVVTITNAAGTVQSAPASLTVTARAPAAGDLRFQQVDAQSTVNGYGGGTLGTGSMLPGLGAQAFALTLGTPLWTAGSDDCRLLSTGPRCQWTFLALPLPSAQSSLGLAAGYSSDSYANLQYDLADPNWPTTGNGLSPAAANAVVTSIDLEPASQFFALSWDQVPANDTSEFSVVQGTVASADLQAAAAAQGASSRVVTAVSYNGSAITYLAYGWSADLATVYDVQVSTAPPADAPAAAGALAAQGYIITATGIADSAGDILFVGTRVQGDTLPRPFMSAQGSGVQTMMLQGYATVAVIVDAGQSEPDTFIGER